MKLFKWDFFDGLNARHEPLPEAGAQRPLEAAGSMPCAAVDDASFLVWRGIVTGLAHEDLSNLTG